MEVEIRLFATLKDRAGQGRVRIALSEPATVESLTQALATAYPALAPALPVALVAVNKAYAGATMAIRPGDEVAIFPPVSGGSDDSPWPTYFAITTDQPDLSAIVAHLTRPDVGAVVTFTGSVRGETDRQGMPPETLYLEYEAYSAMAKAKMAQIAREIWQKWPTVKGVAIVQRIGRLQIGELTTLVACAAAHRDQGVFDAARYGIDRLKEIVPVWKKEVGADHSEWVEGHYRPTESDN
jgi:molybdopterin synthase catalytic subunit